jgi:hypothetical protein
VNVVVLVCAIALLPLQQILAANPTGGTERTHSGSLNGPAVRDIKLGAGGVMKGQVVDAQGKPCSNQLVRVVKQGTDSQVVAACRTDTQGRFQVSGLSGSVYRVETAAGTSVCRAWAPNTAPPAAVPAALVVEGDQAVRGNLSNITPLGWALIGVGIAAAIAIPLALDEEDAS